MGLERRSITSGGIINRRRRRPAASDKVDDVICLEDGAPLAELWVNANKRAVTCHF